MLERSLVRWLILIGTGVGVLVLMNVAAEMARPEVAADSEDSSDGDLVFDYIYRLIPTAAWLLGYGLIVAGWGARWAAAARR